jgi:hypothetical protein
MSSDLDIISQLEQIIGKQLPQVEENDYCN